MTDLDRADTREEAADETGFVLGAGQSAVIADVSEDWTTPIDRAMQKLGGKIYRRARSEFVTTPGSRQSIHTDTTSIRMSTFPLPILSSY